MLHISQLLHDESADITLSLNGSAPLRSAFEACDALLLRAWPSVLNLNNQRRPPTAMRRLEKEYAGPRKFDGEASRFSLFQHLR